MKLHVEDTYIREHYMDGMTGLELESHRIDPDGYLSRREHPFSGDPYIDRDFSEAQMEINTPPAGSNEGALAFLRGQLQKVHRELRAGQELLWPFSNPPAIRSEEDIPVAVYTGEQAPSYHYRLYLAQRYGKYKMTYSGIHFNYSFSEELLRRNSELDQAGDFQKYRDRFYLKLAEKALAYSWVVVALLAASPLVDCSFYETGKTGASIFTGSASLRNSEYGYWNPFVPVLSYESVDSYADSIEKYLDQGVLIEARELYYPIRVKPPGKYTMKALRDKGISHIELRMVDLNPFTESGADIRDLDFLKLFLIWLAAQESHQLDWQEQMQALQNHKTAAGYDWEIGRLTMTGKSTGTLRKYIQEFLEEMETFYGDNPEAKPVLAWQKRKLEQKNRYASQVREQFGEDYLRGGIRRAKEIQEAFHV